MNGTESREENFINLQKSFSKTFCMALLNFLRTVHSIIFFFAISIVRDTFRTRRDDFVTSWNFTPHPEKIFHIHPSIVWTFSKFIRNSSTHLAMQCSLYRHNWHMHKRAFKWTLNALHVGDEANGIGEHLIPLPIPCDGICQKLKSFKLTACASSVASQFFHSSQKISHLTSETFSYPIYLWSWYGMTLDKSSRSAFSGSHPFLSSSPKTESSLPTANKKNYH